MAKGLVSLLGQWINNTKCRTIINNFLIRNRDWFAAHAVNEEEEEEEEKEEDERSRRTDQREKAMEVNNIYIYTYIYINIYKLTEFSFAISLTFKKEKGKKAVRDKSIFTVI